MTYVLIILLFVLQVADWWTTRKILANGGRELNPTVNWLMRILGYEWGLIVAKVIVAVLLLACLGVTAAEVWWWPWVLAALLVWYVGVVGWNVVQMRRA